MTHVLDWVGRCGQYTLFVTLVEAIWSRDTETSFSLISTNPLCFWVTQKPISQDIYYGDYSGDRRQISQLLHSLVHVHGVRNNYTTFGTTAIVLYECICASVSTKSVTYLIHTSIIRGHSWILYGVFKVCVAFTENASLKSHFMAMPCAQWTPSNCSLETFRWKETPTWRVCMLKLCALL